MTVNEYDGFESRGPCQCTDDVLNEVLSHDGKNNTSDGREYCAVRRVQEGKKSRYVFCNPATIAELADYGPTEKVISGGGNPSTMDKTAGAECTVIIV